LASKNFIHLRTSETSVIQGHCQTSEPCLAALA